MKNRHSFILAAMGLLFTMQPALADDGATDVSVQSRSIEFRSPVLARQGNALVTAAEMDAYLSRIPEEDRPGFLRSRARLGTALENLMLPRLIAHEADESGFSERVDVNAMAYQSNVVLIAQEYMDHLFQSQELETYGPKAREIYLTEPELFRLPERVSFTHILILSGRERGELDAMRNMLDVYERLSDDVSFEELAMEYSEDPGVAENSGSYVAVDPNNLDPAVAAVLSLLEPGQISEPVRSTFGWHILRLDENVEGEMLDWEQAEARALELARSRHRDLLFERLVQRLRSEIMDTDIEALQAYLDSKGVDWTLLEVEQAD
ncbi:peptidylprolyl isomerase [Wenzhouxiangella marina]|uniref:peptidylprolyl isomerase n=1 Tax=Wenzhouxiangella marina TaxID=1579979 RepID=A0A0K0XT63_9GAMM|nr:peptidylprolyl isomerase [Wenzhouxiangella marina]AKS40878.1 hypothetical protein WM2015_496 [Wenzhouxiangella marina]MBB6087752.1 hypothetical protein [Wenzhouxiangella marina]